MKASPDDWLRAGLVLLRDRGQDALTIENLCRAMSLTKGSFYHHFADIDAYDERLFGFWEAQHTKGPIAAADAIAGGGAERRRRLHEAVAQLDLHVERAMQAWALRDPRAKRARARVDDLRVAYLARIWKEEGASAAVAQRLARIEYTSFLGSMHLYDLTAEAGAKAARRLAKELTVALRATLQGARAHL